MAQASSKKGAARKSGVAKRKTTAKKPSSLTKNRKPGAATVRRQQEKLEEERTQYVHKIDANKVRLASGHATNGTPLTPAQIAATENIILAQQEKLDLLDKLENSFAEATEQEDPRLVTV